MPNKEKITTKFENKLELFYSVSSWFFAILFLLLGAIIAIGNSLSGIILLIAGLYLLPPINKIVASRAKFKITPIISIVTVVVLFIISTLTINKTYIVNDSAIQTTNNNILTNNPIAQQPSQAVSTPSELKKDDTPTPVAKSLKDLSTPTISTPISQMTSEQLDAFNTDTATADELDQYRSRRQELIAIKQAKEDAITESFRNNISVSNTNFTVIIQNNNKIPLTINYVSINEEPWNNDYYTTDGKTFDINGGKSKTLLLNSFIDQATGINRFDPSAKVANSFHIVGNYTDNNTTYDLDMKFN